MQPAVLLAYPLVELDLVVLLNAPHSLHILLPLPLLDQVLVPPQVQLLLVLLRLSHCLHVLLVQYVLRGALLTLLVVPIPHQHTLQQLLLPGAGLLVLALYLLGEDGLVLGELGVLALLLLYIVLGLIGQEGGGVLDDLLDDRLLVVCPLLDLGVPVVLLPLEPLPLALFQQGLLLVLLLLHDQHVLVPLHEFPDPDLLDLFDAVALESQFLLLLLDDDDPLVLLLDLLLDLVLHLVVLLHQGVFQQLLFLLDLLLDTLLLGLPALVPLLQGEFLLLPHLAVPLFVEEVLLVLDTLLGLRLAPQQFGVFLDLLLHLVLLLGLHQLYLQVFLLLLHHFLLVEFLVLIQHHLILQIVEVVFLLGLLQLDQSLLVIGDDSALIHGQTGAAPEHDLGVVVGHGPRATLPYPALHAGAQLIPRVDHLLPLFYQQGYLLRPASLEVLLVLLQLLRCSLQ